MAKVLNITTKELHADGISNCIINYFENIDSNKIQFGFACPNISLNFKEKIKSKNANIHIIKTNRKKIISYIIELIDIIKNNNYDIVHIHGSSAILSIELIASKLAGCKHRIVHSHNTKTNHPLIDKILRPLFYLLCTERFACGEEAGQWLFKNRKFTIIKNGNNIQKFAYNNKIRKKIRKKNNIDDKIIIGHVGSFNFQKNHQYLIEIFHKLTEKNNKYYLVLIGTGSEEEHIKKMVKDYKLDDKVKFTGVVDNVNEWLNAMDIMLLPSRFEGFPMVLIEWQINGLPCIISDKITKKVKITDLVEFMPISESPEEWATKILQIKLNDRDKIKKKAIEDIADAGYDIVENAKKLQDIYLQIIK